MPTAAFNAAWNRSTRSAVVLAKVVLQSADGLSGKTLCLASRDTTTPGGVFWAAGILDPGTVHAPGGFLTSDVSLCEQTLTIDGHAPLVDTDCAFTLMSGWVWVGAQVTTYLWENSLTSTTDLQQVFVGEVLSVDIDGGALVLALRQRMDWNQPVAQGTLTRADWFNLPDDVSGARKPTAYGRISSPRARKPQFTAPYYTGGHPLSAPGTAGNLMARLRRPGRLVSGFLVEPGRGDGAAQVMFAGHHLSSLMDDGHLPGMSECYMETGDGKLAMLRIAGQTSNTDAGAIQSIPDLSGVAYLQVRPAVLQHSSGFGTPENFACLLDPDNEQSFCTVYGYRDQPLDYIYNYNSDFWVSFASTPSPPGTLSSATLIVLFRHFGAVDIRLFALQATGEFASWLLSGDSAGGWITWEVDATAAVASWKTESLGFGVTAGPGGTKGYPSTNPTNFLTFLNRGRIDIASVVLECCYIPEQPTLQNVRRVSTQTVRPTQRASGVSEVGGPYATFDVLPAVQEMKGRFFANLGGFPDDGSGTYTGTPNAIIERPCDIAKHALVRSGGQLVTQFDSSFTAAPGLLKTWKNTDMILGFGISDATDLMTALSWVAQSSLSWIHLSPYTDKWRFVVWGAAPASATTIPLPLVDLPKVQLQPSSGVVTSVAVSYGYNGFDSSYQHEANLAPDHSCAGYDYNQLNDQSIAVPATDHYIDLLGCTTGNICTYSTTVPRSIVRPSGSFITDGFVAGMTIVSNRLGVQAGTVVSTVAALTLTIDRDITYNTTNTDPNGHPGTVTFPASISAVATVNVTAGDYSEFDDLMAALHVGFRTTPNPLAEYWSFGFGGRIGERSRMVDLNIQCNAYGETTSGLPILTCQGATLAQVLAVGATVTSTSPVGMFPVGTAVTLVTVNGNVVTVQLNHGAAWSTSGIPGTVSFTSTTAVSIATPSGTGSFTMNAYADNVAAALNAALPGWTVAYDAATYKFTIANSLTAFTLLWRTGASAGNGANSRSAAAALGFYVLDKASVVSGGNVAVSDFAVERDLFHLSSGKPFSVCWRTGPNGPLANPQHVTSANEPLGCSLYDDTPYACFASGVAPKGNLQSRLRQAVRRYISSISTGAARKDLTIDGRAIYDTDTALELRNRVALASCTPHIVVTCSVEGAVGLERGDAIQFPIEMDALRPYPDPDSDGSWVGKKLIVVETDQHLGPDSFFTDVVAVSV